MRSQLPSNREVHEAFPAEPSTRYDRAAFGWVVAFYASYGALLMGWLPGWAFAALGVVAIVRNFNALHEAFHAVERPSLFTRARRVPIVMAPWQLGYRELRKNHREHHAHEGGERDPDRYLIVGNPLWALLQAFTQPEQSVVRYVSRKGVDAPLAMTLAWHGAIWVVLALVSPWEWFLLYNAVTRFGNTAAWWIFDYWLHQEALYHRLEALPMPGVVVRAWALLFSRPNIEGVRHHYLHHTYPFVPDRRLPELAARLRTPAE